MFDPNLVMTILGPSAGPTIGRISASIAATYLGKKLKTRAVRKQAAEVCVEAFECWVEALLREYLERGHKEEALRERFLHFRASEAYFDDEEVCAELLRPFTDSVADPILDSRLLVARWHSLGLPALPEGFDADRACSWYVEEVNRLRMAIDCLRAHLQAQKQQQSIAVLEDIRGLWSETDLNQYADAMRETYQLVDATTLKLAGRENVNDEFVRLKDIFVPQDARRCLVSRILPRDYLSKSQQSGLGEWEGHRYLKPSWLGDEDYGDLWETTAREPIFDILTSDEIANIVVLGGPGSGKSCLSRYISLRLLEGLGKEPREPEPLPCWVDKLNGPLPFLIELRRFARWEASKKDGRDGFIGYLHHRGTDHGFGLNRSGLDQLFSNKLTLVIFDGLDEVTDPIMRKDISDLITGFARRYARTKVVVTSRIIGFDPRPFLVQASGFKIATLDDLDCEQVRRFSETWFNLSLPFDPERALRCHTHLMAAITSRPQLGGLAGNPLLLTIIAFVAQREELPSRRGDLYAHALHVFCHLWDFDAKNLELPTNSQLTKLDDSDKLDLLHHIAWSMKESGRLSSNIVEEKELRHWIADFFNKTIGDSDWRRCEKASREAIHVLEGRNNVLCCLGTGIYGFIHRTFLEYLCASEILRRINENQNLSIATFCATTIRDHGEDESWQEIIRLLVTMLRDEDAACLINALLDIRIDRWSQKIGREATPALTLAVECLGERAEWDRPCFRDARERVTKRALEDSSRDVREATVQALGQHAGMDESVRTLLIGWGENDDDVFVRRAAVKALGSHSGADDEVRALMIARAVLDEDAPVRLCAVEALGPYAANEKIQAELIAKATSDSSEDVRRAAVKALGPHSGADGKVRSELFARVEEEDSWWIRRVAVGALGSYVLTDGGVRALLIARATRDSNEFVRSDAVEQLGRHASMDGEIRAQLFDWAANNDDVAIRRAAVHALGQHLGTDKSVWLQLLEWATKDDDWGVRRSAVHALAPQAGTNSAVKALLIDVAAEDEEGAVRCAAVLALGPYVGIDNKVKTLLLDKAGVDDELYVRWDAVEALGHLVGTDDKVRALLLDRAAKDDDVDVQFAALDALSQQAGTCRKMRARLVAKAKEDKDREIRWAAVHALGPLAKTDREVRELFIDMVAEDNNDAYLRWDVVEQLGRHAGSDEAVQAFLFMKAEQDDDASVRAAAAKALGRHAGSDEVVRAFLILKAEQDDDASVRQATVGVLGQHAGMDEAVRGHLLAGTVKDRDEDVRRSVVLYWIKEFGDRQAANLLSQYFDGDEPFLDPLHPITADRVKNAAKHLHIDEDAVRAFYESISEKFSLILEWYQYEAV